MAGSVLVRAALVAVVSVVWASGAGPAAGAGAEPVTRCGPGGGLAGVDGWQVRVRVCVVVEAGAVTVSAPAECRPVRGAADPGSCATSGTWSMVRRGREVASGALGSRAAYPGPGTYTVTAAVRVGSEPAGAGPSGSAAASFVLTEPLPRPTHRVRVSAAALRPGRTVTARYTVTSTAVGDDSARLGLIGRAGTTVTSADPQCRNPLAGAHPSTARRTWVLDCSLTDVQPGRARTVTVRITAGKPCSAVVSRLGYWTPRGQNPTGQMVTGPAVGCATGR
jgi:hypothetical protein